LGIHRTDKDLFLLIEDIMMYELLEIDNYRIGIFTKGEIKVKTPCLARFDKEVIDIGGIQYKKPFFKGIKENGYLRPYYSIPEKIGKKFLEPLRKDVVPIHVLSSKKLNEIYEEFEGEIFLFKGAEERRFLKVFLDLREKHPDKLFFIDCLPEEIPIYAFLGFDVFPYSEEHEKALENFLENKNKNYLEKESNSSIKTKRLLRIAYKEFSENLLRNMKVKNKKEIYISTESLYRPEAVYWRKKIGENYIPQSDFIVLLPCSAKKPYSRSKSHIKFIESIKKGLKNKKQYYGITQLILTSPLGVVPRELEDYADYDIVVTGDWSCEEKHEAKNLLDRVLKKVENPRIIAHLPEEYRDLCKEAEFTDDLNETIRKYNEEIPEGEDIKFRKVSEFLYGVDIFPENIMIKKRKYTFEIYSKELLARYDRKLTLTLKGAELLYEHGKNYVEIDFDLKGDVFCRGVVECDENIKAGEDVVVVRKGKVVGIGKAVVPGYMMKKLERGKAVKVSRSV